MDNQLAFSSFQDGGLYGLADGKHTLHAWISPTPYYAQWTGYTEVHFTVGGAKSLLAAGEGSGVMGGIATALTSQITAGLPSGAGSAVQSPGELPGESGIAASSPAQIAAAPLVDVAKSQPLVEATDEPAAVALDDELLSQLATEQTSAKRQV